MIAGTAGVGAALEVRPRNNGVVNPGPEGDGDALAQGPLEMQLPRGGWRCSCPGGAGDAVAQGGTGDAVAQGGLEMQFLYQGIASYSLQGLFSWGLQCGATPQVALNLTQQQQGWKEKF
jgi:hypothetical protein